MDEKDPWGPCSASAAYAIRSTFHTTLKATQGQLVFGRDMVLPIKFMADWGAIEQQRQKEIGRNNRRENSSRISHDYRVEDKILLKKPGWKSTYSKGQSNIRRFFPYFEDANH
jgi:hypothetical protein